MLFSQKRVHQRFDSGPAVGALRDDEYPALLDLLDSDKRHLTDEYIEKTVEFQHPVFKPDHDRNCGIREHAFLQLEDRIARFKASSFPPANDDATALQTTCNLQYATDLNGTPADESDTGPTAARGIRGRSDFGSKEIWHRLVSKIEGCGGLRAILFAANRLKLPCQWSPAQPADDAARYIALQDEISRTLANTSRNFAHTGLLFHGSGQRDRAGSQRNQFRGVTKIKLENAVLNTQESSRFKYGKR